MKLVGHMKLVLASIALGPAIAIAQAYPDKPVRLIVPFPPGGTADIMARVVSDRMGHELGMPVVVENKAGGRGWQRRHARDRACRPRRLHHWHCNGGHHGNLARGHAGTQI